MDDIFCPSEISTQDSLLPKIKIQRRNRVDMGKSGCKTNPTVCGNADRSMRLGSLVREIEDISHLKLYFTMLAAKQIYFYVPVHCRCLTLIPFVLYRHSGFSVNLGFSFPWPGNQIPVDNNHT